MRKIKFRFRNKNNGQLIEFSLTDLLLHHRTLGDNIDWENPMQFTGLHDRNSKEIWQGDIVQLADTTWHGFRRTIIFKKGCFGYEDVTGKFHPLAIKNGNKGDETQWDVIGDIYSNPELLGGSHETK